MKKRNYCLTMNMARTEERTEEEELKKKRKGKISGTTQLYEESTKFLEK